MDLDRLKEIELFLFDMDGTIYLDDILIEGSLELINLLKEQNKSYVFLTNNSSKNIETYLNKLNNLGLDSKENNLFTSSQATAMYIKDTYDNPKVYCVGTKDLRNELRKYKIEVVEELDYSVNAVVVGFDTELNYEKVKIACELISSGKDYIGTNMDLVCPVSGGKFIPDCGSICNLISTAVNKKPKYIGKPNKEMVNIIAKKLNIPKDKIAVVGDRLYTDIAVGVNAGITSICVLTGETKIYDLNNSSILPTFTLESVNDIYNIIK
jgi:phosphoglycolate/pyridoxal phosphate phosphatase family enzyme